MFVLGIDPGLSRCGYGLVAKSGALPVTTADPRTAVTADPRTAAPADPDTAAPTAPTSDRPTANLVAVAAGVLETDPGLALPERLRLMRDELRELMAELRPDVVAVERVFFQVNARTAMSVGQASGLALAEAAAAGAAVAQYTANEVKQALSGWGAADKEQVRRMVATVLGLTSVPGPPDVADALALAVCHFFGAPVRRAVAEALR